MTPLLEHRPITRADIEMKLRELRMGAESGAQTTKTNSSLVAVVALAALALVVAYFLGKRRGRKRRAWIEIKRV